MRIFIYEFVTGGGWYWEPSAIPPASLAAEGAAMLAALVADFCAVDGARVDVMRDARLPFRPPPGCTLHPVSGADQERETFRHLAAAADESLIVAPEFAGHLAARCLAVDVAGGKLLGPGSKLVQLLSDKHDTAEYLRARGVNTPGGIALEAGDRLPEGFSYPAMLKPRDGAGSQGIRRIEQWKRDEVVATPSRLEMYCPGTAASVACLCGAGQILPLAPCLQSLSDDGQFQYRGGSLPLDPRSARRAARMAAQAVGTLDRPLGYLGVDLVLGADASGALDRVIEINPRVTTSYVGLRALAGVNLAAAMLATAAGREVELSWKPGSIQFDAAGEVKCGCPSSH